MLPSPLPLQVASLLPQCLMPGHTATEYAIRVGDMPLHPHPHPGQPLDPKGRSCHGLPSAPPVYLSSHPEWRLINTVHGDQAQAQLPLLSCTLGSSHTPARVCGHTQQTQLRGRYIEGTSLRGSFFSGCGGTAQPGSGPQNPGQTPEQTGPAQLVPVPGIS